MKTDPGACQAPTTIAGEKPIGGEKPLRVEFVLSPSNGFLFLVASLLLVAMPGAPSSDALAPSSFLGLFNTPPERLTGFAEVRGSGPVHLQQVLNRSRQVHRSV